MSGLVRPLAELAGADLASAGGKGAGLGELVRAGFRVPAAFVVTTEAYALAARAAGVDPRLPAEAAERLRAAPIPEPVAAAVKDAWVALGRGPVAVRSSATAEDLPGASFAGQQDTFLEVAGEAAVLDAVKRCWASLWNPRAVAYRHANAVDEAGMGLAVVIQRMVDAAAAGVLFSADPLTGRRRRAVIEVVAGYGDKLVSGVVDPDHYVVDCLLGEVVERRPTGPHRVLEDADLLGLAALGEKVEEHFGAPQDIEFALDQDRELWLVQSRPITTLYPLPPNPPDPTRDLRTYWSANVFQGYLDPFTPMGIQFFRLVATAVYRAFGAHVDGEAAAGPDSVVEAGMRLYLDLTPVVRDRLGRAAFAAATAWGEARTAVVLSHLARDPRLEPLGRSRARSLLRLAKALTRVGVPRSALRVVRTPDATRARYVREMQALVRSDLPPGASATDRLDAFERLVLTGVPEMLPRLLGIMAPAMLSLALARRLLRGRASEEELQTVTRGAPHNPTTEMDLALWALSREVAADSGARDALLGRPLASLVAAYHAGTLPEALQTGLSTFLSRFGFRSIGEIDIGVRRWSEDPSHIVGVLANYLRLGDSAIDASAQFTAAEREAEAMVTGLISRLRGPRRLLARSVLRRVRLLMGSREAPKFYIIKLLASPAREHLRGAGADLAERGCIVREDDIFFLTLPEARRAAAGEDLRPTVAIRRHRYEVERRRRRIPRLLLSDGTDAEAALVSTGGDLHGSPASPGVARGTARVIRSPQGARLEPGEILVAPSTDPGWTPLFLTAGALVMEMGGMMSHGAVVAREYGIPAVVGVAGALERIATGQRVTVDGTAGTIAVEDAESPPRMPALGAQEAPDHA